MRNNDEEKGISEEKILILRTEQWGATHVKRERKKEHVVEELCPYLEVPASVSNCFPLWTGIKLNASAKVKSLKLSTMPWKKKSKNS